MEAETVLLWDNVPVEKVEGFAENLKLFAEKHGYIVSDNPNALRKIEWMANHGGRCYCGFRTRKCPCSHCHKEIRSKQKGCWCKVLLRKDG